MFGVNLSVLTDRELSVLYNDLDEHMRALTGTWSWPMLRHPVTESIWTFLMGINTETHARDVVDGVA